MKIDLQKLLDSLTLDQKLAQLAAGGPYKEFVTADNKFNTELCRSAYPNGFFGMMVPVGVEPEVIGQWVCELYECTEDLSPVPPLVMCESLHGILGKGATMFPQSIGMGGTFDPDLMRRVGEAIGKEARAMGIRLSLAPDLDLGRDPRWGRIEETYGESSYLVRKMGEAYVEGLVSKDRDYVACVKHFAAHGHPVAGINLSPVTVTPQELEDKYLPPFKAAIDAGAMSVMPAYSALNGVPCHGNKFLMEDILRENWGFDGVVISDFGGIEMMNGFQRCTENMKESGRLAFSVGVDVEAPYPRTYRDLKALVEEGAISMEAIDKSVMRILKLKADIGLFDMELPTIDNIRRTVRSDEHKALAREAARKSMTLLKNNGMLPINTDTCKKIAVVGPNAYVAQIGDYAIPQPELKTPLTAITERVAKFGGTVVSAKGCSVYGTDTSGFAEAEEVARSADAVICIIGGQSSRGAGIGWGTEDESILTCGEGCDVHELIPGGPQLDLVRKMIEVGKPVTVVMIDGRPETLFDAADNCDALIAAWYPGEEGSNALAELLFGDANFSGKLPVTFPRHVGQIPIYHDRVPSECGFYKTPGTPEKPGRDYVFGPTTPAYEFGYGIGYSEIKYSDLSAERVDDGIKVTLALQNVGKYAAEESVLVFVRDEVASIPQPIKKLAGFKKVTLNEAETAAVEILIPNDELMFTGVDMVKRLEAGWFTVMVGGLETRVYVK
ncbi:MAG: glycoside hydrolase family 3 C-terminal domain-containing protein [Clostridia bacterium]|nr:glycoside hydrolase family 3 C-terminal domain-containing protein [Clostridia bacterium]